MTSELERIKILESKINRIVDYINKLVGENERLKQQIKDLKSEKKDFEVQRKKAEEFDILIKKYENEREILQSKIETMINQINEIGI